MKAIIIFSFAVLNFALVNFSSLAIAEVKKDSSKECTESIADTNFGVIASVGNYSTGGFVIDGDVSDATPGGVPSKITASIKKLDNSKCETVVSNTSKCIQYTTSIAINEGKAGGKPVTKSTNSMRLKPGESNTIAFSCSPSANYQIEILSAKGSLIKK